MKKIILKTIVLSVVALTTVAMFSPGAFAATFNTDPADYQTLRVGNVTKQPGTTSSGWGTSITATPGDIIAVAVYYHNTSLETAKDVRVKITPKNDAEGINHVIRAEVWSENTPIASGSVSISLSEPRSLDYIEGSATWRPNQTTYGSSEFPFGQEKYHIFTTSGIRIGDIAPGWSSQGNVVVSFKVNENGGSVSGSKFLSVVSLSPDSVGLYDATLKGSVASNDTVSVSTWFEWGTSVALGNKTGVKAVSLPNRSSSFTGYVSGLLPNTLYYYRAVASSASATNYGQILSFKTGSGAATAVGKEISVVKSVENITSPNGTQDEVSALRGDVLRFTFTLKNNGSETLKNIEVRDLVSEYLKLVSNDSGNTDCGIQKKVVWKIGELNAGDEKKISLDTVVCSEAPYDESIKNGGDTAVVEADGILRSSNETFVKVFEERNFGAIGAIAGLGFSFSKWALVFGMLVLILAIFYCASRFLKERNFQSVK